MAYQLKGVITAMLTPFDEDGSVMTEVVKGYVQFQQSKGVDGLFVCGSTGLFPLMSVQERKKVLEETVEAAKGRMKIIAQVGSADTGTAIQLAKHAEETGADAVAAVTPFYYRHGEEEIYVYYRRLASAVKLPLFVYNIPGLSGNNVSLRLLQRLHSEGLVKGMKDTSGDFLQLLEKLENLPADFYVYTGTQGYIFAALKEGAAGLVAALGNVFPELLVGLYSSFTKGDDKKAREMQKKVNLAKRITDDYPLISLYSILEKRGIRYGRAREPFLKLGEKEAEKLMKSINSSGLL